VLYNRASADPDGKPWSERKALIWWDPAGDDGKGRWVGHDVPDFQVNKPPHYQPEDGATGPDALAGDDAFIMQGDGKGWLYAPKGTVDGPLPTHYEPAESPYRNALYTQQQNPTRQVYTHRVNPMHPSPPEGGSEVFPFVWTTARLTEHHTAGGMSRYLSKLAELQPELFVEVSPELARFRGLTHGGWAQIISARAVIEARVLVTDRLNPLMVQGKPVHQIWLPYHWGPGGLAPGDVVNDLPPLALDPNVHIQECKAGTCDVLPGRRPRGPAVLELMDSYRERAGITPKTGTVASTAHFLTGGTASHLSGPDNRVRTGEDMHPDDQDSTPSSRLPTGRTEGQANGGPTT
jgi:formate dehydrogenase major subunit